MVTKAQKSRSERPDQMAQSRDIAEDIKRGFFIGYERRTERFDAYWNWCKQNGRILVEVRLRRGGNVGCKIDTFPPDCVNHPFRFSEAQIDDLVALCKKHNWRKGSKVCDVFSTLHFTKEDALAFAADVAEWLKTVEIPK